MKSLSNTIIKIGSYSNKYKKSSQNIYILLNKRKIIKFFNAVYFFVIFYSIVLIVNIIFNKAYLDIYLVNK